jgi:hypothetical protein
VCVCVCVLLAIRLVTEVIDYKEEEDVDMNTSGSMLFFETTDDCFGTDLAIAGTLGKQIELPPPADVFGTDLSIAATFGTPIQIPSEELKSSSSRESLPSVSSSASSIASKSKLRKRGKQKVGRVECAFLLDSFLLSLRRFALALSSIFFWLRPLCGCGGRSHPLFPGDVVFRPLLCLRGRKEM